MFCLAKNINPSSGVVDDLLVLEVAKDALKETAFEYVILNNEAKAIRKGNFKGPLVQLCTRFFSQGTYKLQLKSLTATEHDEIIFNKA